MRHEQVSRLRHIPGIGVDRIGDAADAAADETILRLENLDTDLPPPAIAVAATHRAVADDAANSYLPFQGHWPLREAIASHVGRFSGVPYDPRTQCLSVAGGLNGITNTLLATVETGQEVVLFDPIYAGLVNRVRLAGGIPRHVRCRPGPSGWQTDPDELAAAIGPNTAAVLLMGPAMPTGALVTAEHLAAIAGPTNQYGAWLIYDAAMERLRFDGRPPLHPASHPDLTDRVITVGSASKELRMIGWRVGWVAGPAPIMADIGLVGLTNVVCQVGIAQQAVADALNASDADADVAAASSIWHQRAEHLLTELAEYPCVRPDGGWSLLIDTRPLGLPPAELSSRLFRHGRVAATPMTGWGPSGEHYLRLVYANEPIERLRDIKARFEQALR
jgi:aspartate/methionine/tyrosine aminotransferase